MIDDWRTYVQSIYLFLGFEWIDVGFIVKFSVNFIFLHIIRLLLTERRVGEYCVMKALFIEQTEGPPGKVSQLLSQTITKTRSIILSVSPQFLLHPFPSLISLSKSSLPHSITETSLSVRIYIPESTLPSPSGRME